MTETMMQTPMPIDLEQFERLVYSRRYEDATAQLINVIAGIKQGAGFQWSGAEPSVEALFTRLASAITALLASPEYAMSFDGFVILAANHATLHSIFRVSTFKNSDYLMNLIGKRDAADATRINFNGGAEVPKMLLAWSLESSTEFSWEELAKTAPDTVAAALIGILGIGGIHTNIAYNRKIDMLKKWPLIDAVETHESEIVPMCDVYMHCSYVDVPWKHDIKRTINRQMRRLVERKCREAGIKITERTVLERKERPTILIPIEWFGSHHAMYRCYAPSIRELRQHFYVVGVARESDVDDVSEKEFDKCIKIPPEKASIFDLMQAVNAEKPDILFYPSIGMAGWWVALSNFRLAPLQIMCPGHPATTYSDTIDYMVSDGDLFGDESLYSEQCVGLPVGAVRYINSSKIDRSQFVKENDGVVRIAVSAMAMKLVPPFLKALKEINEQSVSIEWHIFPNMIAAFHHLITTDLQKWLPGAIVHPRMTYSAYMQTLGQCDLMLSSFPFCGTNSVIDAFLCNIPVLAKEGQQIHERSGASMIRRVKLPEDLIAHSTEEYCQTAIDLIQDKTRLKALQQQLRDFDVEAEFYGEGPAELRGKFGEAFWNIYQREVEKHERNEQELNALLSIG
jgi:hypothetical protein